MSLLGDTWPFAIQGLIAPPSAPSRASSLRVAVQRTAAHTSFLLVCRLGEANASTKGPLVLIG